MGLVEDIQSMQEQGVQEQDIVQKLMSTGYQEQEIRDAMSQTQIKNAVSGTQEEMQPSMMGDAPQPGVQEQEAAPYPGLPPSEEQQPAAGYQAYQGYQPTQLSSDTIAEIAEQVTMEKLSGIRQHLEKTLDMKTVFEAKLESLDQRLQRIEKLIDRLQLSILQKVGEYVTNVEDIKKEMQETQTSFKAMVDEKHAKKKAEQN